MPDFDVAAVGLAVPPPLASLTTYRPTITVRNNGIHAALATGSIRIYKAGSLVFSSDVYSATIPPGETRPAQALEYWTPDTVGSYMLTGYVTCASDQVERNNQLAPVTIIVGATPPPPPAPVTLHASQHEEGGQDELTIDGLGGVAKDKQDPYDHASNHQPGGTDELDVTDMRGQLLDPQPPLTHANEAHNPTFTTAAETTAAINAHNDQATAHEVGIESIANGVVVIHNADPTAHPSIGFQQGPTLFGAIVAPAQTKEQFSWSLPGAEVPPAEQKMSAFRIEGMCYVTYNLVPATVQLDLKLQGFSKARIVLTFAPAAAQVYQIMYDATIIMRVLAPPLLDSYMEAVVMFKAYTYKQTTPAIGSSCAVYGCADRAAFIPDPELEIIVTIDAGLTSADAAARIQPGSTVGYRTTSSTVAP